VTPCEKREREMYRVRLKLDTVNFIRLLLDRNQGDNGLTAAMIDKRYR
jgi:hypothetical protein